MDCESLKGVERFNHHLRKIDQSWDDWQSTVIFPFWEQYLYGNVDFVFPRVRFINGHAEKREVCVRISAVAEARKIELFEGPVFGPDFSYCHMWQDEVVLFNFVYLGEFPETPFPSLVRFYNIPEEVLNIRLGEGGLYSSQAGGLRGYKAFPTFMERPVNEISLDSLASTHGGSGVVKGCAKIVYRIPDNESQVLGDVIFGGVGQLSNYKIWIGPTRAYVYCAAKAGGFTPANFVEVGQQWLGEQSESLDMMLGPMDLEIGA